MFYAVEGKLMDDRVLNGACDMTWGLPDGPFTLTMPEAMFEGAQMHKTWSLRFHHDDPDAQIFGRLAVNNINRNEDRAIGLDTFRVSFDDLAHDLVLAITETDVVAEFAQHMIATEKCWVEIVAMP